MNRTKRILALSLILCLLLGCAAGFTACSSAKVLFTVDGVGVTDGYFSFYMSQYLSAMASDLGDNMISSSDMIDESTTAGDYVKDIIYESIVNDYATIDGQNYITNYLAQKDRTIKENVGGYELEWADVDMEKCDWVFQGGAELEEGEKGNFFPASKKRAGKYKPSEISPFVQALAGIVLLYCSRIFKYSLLLTGEVAPLTARE